MNGETVTFFCAYTAIKRGKTIGLGDYTLDVNGNDLSGILNNIKELIINEHYIDVPDVEIVLSALNRI